MKKYYFLFSLITLFFNSKYLTAQVTDVITGIELPTSVLLNGNDIYIGKYQGALFKYDITLGTSPTLVLPSNGIYRTTKLGDFIYASKGFSGKISKIDISTSIPIAVDLISNLNFPAGLAVKDNFLYFAENGLNGTISKIDLNQINPQKITIVSGIIEANGIGIIDNYLYYSQWTAGTISKIDITSDNPVPIVVVSGLLNPTEIIVNGNNLLVSEFSNNKVLNVDVSTSAAIVTDLVTDILNPTGLFLNGIDLYISVFGEDRIVKFTSEGLGVSNNELISPKLSLSPNPSSDFIQISGLKGTEKYTINNSNGVQIATGIILNKQKLYIQNMEAGTYFICFENGINLKFIKK